MEGNSATSIRSVGQWPIYVFSVVVLISLLVMSLWVDGLLVRNARQDVGRELRAVMTTTERALEHWYTSLEATLSYWSNDRTVVEYAKRLVEMDPDSRSFRESNLHSELTDHLNPILSRSGIFGFTVASLDGLILADLRSSEVDRRIVDNEILEVLEKLLQEKTAAVIGSPQRGKGKDFAVILGASAITDSEGRLIGVLGIRIDPDEEFTQILQRGRMGESGESYAFNSDGKMVSGSRFDDALKDLALVPRLGQSILTVDIRDPGGNLLEGYRPTTIREKQPLTFMASSAIDQGVGENLTGYNDYRGVPVIGSWDWKSEHNIGITTEIDVAEAYQAMETTRRLFRLLSTLTGVLVIFLTAFFVRNRSQIATALHEQKRLATTIKENAKDIEEARVQLDAVFQNSPLGLILFNKEGVIQNCNDRFVQLMGSSREKLVGFNTLTDASDPGVRESLRKAISGEWADYEGQYTSATGGKTIDLRIIYNPVNPKQVPTEVIASLEDISDRREAEQKLEAVSESAPDAIVIADSAGNITSWNRAAEQIIGWSEAEMLGQPLEVIIPERYCARHRKGIEGVVKSGEGRILGKPVEVSALHREGHEISIELSLSTWMVGSKRYFTGMIRDITERKKMERELLEAREAAEAANKAKSSFLANMSHELRTPMNAIIGYTEMLQEEAEDLNDEDDLFSDDLTKIHSAGKHLLSLINDVLDLSKIESGKMELYNEKFELAPLTEDIASTIHSLIAKNGNELKVELGEEVGQMHADITKIRQSLFNLLSNAAKFTKEGTITLSVDRLTEEGSDWITFAVSDTGIGVAQDKLDSLFEEFSQADESTTRQYGGTGLGLAITKRFCEMMGGSIVVTSELGVGTTFTIRLPAVVESKTKEEVVSTKAAVAKALSGVENGATILVIDDEETARELLRRSLEKDGYSVALASGGEQGLELARRVKPAVITLDVMMPQMDGWAVLRALKEDEDLRDIPVIMVTIVSDREMMFALGAVEHLTKPVDRETLRRLILKYTSTGEGGKALIIEDDEPSRSMLRRTLEDFDWDVEEAENGAVGLERLDRTRPDLILLDLMMPVMDGFEFVDEIRKREECKTIPIIVVSAKDLTSDDRQRLHGAVAVILEKGSHTTDLLMQQIRKLT